MSAFSVFGTNNIIGPTVSLPTVSGHIATYTNTTGNLSVDPSTAISSGNIQAGLSGTAGSLVSFPTAAGTGSLILAASSNAGSTNVTITNASNAQTSTLTLPDPGLSGIGTFILNSVNTSFSTGQNISGSVNITGTSSSTSTTSGSLTLGGGLGLLGSIYIGSSTAGTYITNNVITAHNTTEFINFTASYGQIGSKLIGSGFSGSDNESTSIAISSDGSTFVFGGPADFSSIGATWVFVRSGSSFLQSGSKIVGSGYSGASGQGSNISSNSDGSLFITSGPSDNTNNGATWVFIRTLTTYYQIGSKLVGSGFSGASGQGPSSLSADGATVAIGGLTDNASIGATWIFVRTSIASQGFSYIQQGLKLTGSGFSGASGQGQVSLSIDGNTLAVGGPSDNASLGAIWIFTRTLGIWSQQGSKLIGSGFSGASAQGSAVSISSDGNTLLLGSKSDNGNIGASWVFVRSSGTWSQQGSKLVGSGFSGASGQGFSVSMNGSATTAIIGASADNANIGATWFFSNTNGRWSQQGSKFTGSGSSGSGQQGYSVSIDSGQNILIGAPFDNSSLGTVYYLQEPLTGIQVNGSLTVNGFQNTIAGTTTFQGPISVANTVTTENVVLPTTAITDNVITSSSQMVITSNTNSTAFTQLGPKLVGYGYSGAPNQGVVTEISNDESTIATSGRADNGAIGATWVFARTGAAFVQIGNKLVGSGASGASQQGGNGSGSISINNDGTLVVVGGLADNGNTGATWIFIRTGPLGSGYIGLSTTQGFKLVASGSSGASAQGAGISISSDSSTLAVGGYTDTNGIPAVAIGATWIFIRSGNSYVQQGTKLVGTGYSGQGLQGGSVNLSTDGNTLVVSGTQDYGSLGAVWIFVRSTGNLSWSQQGAKLIGSGYSGTNPSGLNTGQGYCVRISADGNTVTSSGNLDNGNIGATWIFVRSNGSWSQQGSKLVGSGYSGTPQQGLAMDLAPSGNTIAIGGITDYNNQIGATWIFTQSGGTWSQLGSKLIGTNAVGTGAYSNQGSSMAISGSTITVGGFVDIGGSVSVGANWVFTQNNGSVTINAPGGLYVNGPVFSQVQSQSYYIIYAGQNQSIGSSSNTVLTTYFTAGPPSPLFNPVFSGTAIINSTAGLLQVTQTGLYFISTIVSYANTAAGYRQVLLYKNTIVANAASTTSTLGDVTQTSTQGDRSAMNLTTIAFLTANDYVAVYGFQTSGGSINADLSVNGTNFSMFKVA